LPLSDSEVLAGAGFINLKTWAYEAPQTYSLCSLIGFLASTSYASLQKFGSNAVEFEKNFVPTPEASFRL
jgi:hypothetical protein